MGRRSLVVAATARLLLLSLAVGGCSTTSNVEMRSGATYEAHIVGGSPGSVYLSNKDNGRFSVRREDVVDVDLPGNVAILGGIALGAVGGWRLRVGDTRCGTFADVGTCMLNVAPLVVGFFVTMWGSYVYRRADRAFADQSKPEPSDAPMKLRPPGELPHPPGWRKPDPFAEPRP